jgi:hypothetical protein
MAQLPFFKVGDFGQTIRRTIVDEKNDPVDLQTATLMEFHFKDPSGAVSTKNNTTHGVAFTNGTGDDGQVEYVVESAVLNAEGVWMLQVQITAVGFVIYTDQEELTVSPVLA